MSDKSNSSVYIGNLDEKVSERVLYDILIQAGRVVELHIPRDRDTDKPKGFAFAEYESEDIAAYAVKLSNLMGIVHTMTALVAITVEEYLGQCRIV